MLSSAGRPEDKSHAKTLGVAHCMTKPVTQSILFNIIASVFETARRDKPAEDMFAVNRTEHFVPRQILLAEDGVVNRQVAVSLLEQRGHRVTAVENGQLVVEAFAAKTFDLILMDVQMPVLDGFAATAAIRKLEAVSGGHIPIIAMTAHAMKGDRQRCLDAGMDDYVSKPFRPHELFESVERVKPTTNDDKDAADSDATFSLNDLEPGRTQATNGSRAFNRNEALRNVG